MTIDFKIIIFSVVKVCVLLYKKRVNIICFSSQSDMQQLYIECYCTS